MKSRTRTIPWNILSEWKWYNNLYTDHTTFRRVYWLCHHAIHGRCSPPLPA